MGRPPAHRERGLELAESEERERREVGRFKTLEPVDELETLFEGASVQKITGFAEFWIRHADPKANAKPDALCRRALPANNATNNVANNAQLEGTIVKRAILTLITVSCLQTSAFATWSVIAVDRSTGQVIIASATCVPQTRFPQRPSRDLMDVQAVIVPGMGVAACQAGVDNTRANQMIVFAELKKGTAPERIIELLREHENAKDEPQMERRQFGIVDLQGRTAGFNGENNRAAALYVSGEVGDDIFFQVQGNILFSDNVGYNAALAFTRAKGTLADRVMAAMEAADEAGGDQRCTCEEEPKPAAPCDGKTAHVAYISIANKDDAVGSSHNDGDYYAYISVTDENIEPHENANPVRTLRLRYDAWKNMGSKRTGIPPSVIPQ